MQVSTHCHVLLPLVVAGGGFVSEMSGLGWSLATRFHDVNRRWLRNNLPLMPSGGG